MQPRWQRPRCERPHGVERRYHNLCQRHANAGRQHPARPTTPAGDVNRHGCNGGETAVEQHRALVDGSSRSSSSSDRTGPTAYAAAAAAAATIVLPLAQHSHSPQSHRAAQGLPVHQQVVRRHPQGVQHVLEGCHAVLNEVVGAWGAGGGRRRQAATVAPAEALKHDCERRNTHNAPLRKAKRLSC
jgi:hypothetical protein